MPEKSSTDTKARILFLLQYLQANTDDDHVITTNDLIALLEQNGFKANRDTIRDDIAVLNDAGYEVISQRHGKGNAYHYGSRTFEWPEMRMLADAVSSSQFISPKKSRALIRKLASLASKHMSRRLTSNIHTADWRKAGSDKIFLIIDAINEAIERHKKIFFQYVEYSPKREKILRHGGEVYINSPYALIWQEDRYYLVGYSDKHERVVSFRVDR
ncbi:MAG: WYL domain-containing protein, partial [Selenomonadaceae bacterium]|nr:WYL domain-containing protein [Selenomonadaceae bacterium]